MHFMWKKKLHAHLLEKNSKHNREGGEKVSKRSESQRENVREKWKWVFLVEMEF